MPLYVTPDVPTTETATGGTLLPWQIFRYESAGPSYTLELTVPGDPHIDGIHKMDEPGDWLLSIEAPNDLGGSLAVAAEPRDVIHFDSRAAAYGVFFCGGAAGIPVETNVDALYLEGGDAGNLIVSFDVPTELPPGSGTLYEPGDLVRFEPSGGLGCAAWVLSASNPAFDATGPGVVPSTDNIIGADGGLGQTILSVDVPSDLAPSVGPATYVPGQLVSWDGTNFSLFEPLIGWPLSSLVDGVACLANPGRIPPTITLGRAGPADITVTWSASCAEGGEDYGIYEGTIGNWYSHTSFICEDGGAPLTETFTPSAGDTYYVVVSLNAKVEGSYGQDSNGTERPVGSAVCVSRQVVTPCPP